MAKGMRNRREAIMQLFNEWIWRFERNFVFPSNEPTDVCGRVYKRTEPSHGHGGNRYGCSGKSLHLACAINFKLITPRCMIASHLEGWERLDARISWPCACCK